MVQFVAGAVYGVIPREGQQQLIQVDGDVMDVAQCPDRPSTPFLFEEPAIRSSCASSPLNQGLRNGGGIGDILRAPSIKVSFTFSRSFFQI